MCRKLNSLLLHFHDYENSDFILGEVFWKTKLFFHSMFVMGVKGFTDSEINTPDNGVAARSNNASQF
ncbi:hypothetical protein Bca4012_092171 [Brassica carinata]